MGGRGGSGGTSNVAGLKVTKDGETTSFYFYHMDGKNYYQRGLGEFPKETPNNMSMSEFKQRLIRNGAEVKNISVLEKRQAEIARKSDREETDRMLDIAYVSDRMFVKGSRAERVRNRASKRNRRR